MNNRRRPVALRRESAAVMLFLAPSVLGFSVFYLIPFVLGISQSLTNRTLGGHFTGLSNYAELLASGSFRKAAANTLLFTSISVPLLIVLSLGLALLINKGPFFRQGLQTALILPLVVPVASVVLVWQIFVDWNGTLNAWLVHAGHSRVDWLQSGASMGVLVVLYLWKNLGYNLILFLAGLQQIPRDYYETARIEGAGRWHQFTRITLVYLTPTLFFVVLISIINSFKVFRETYLLAGDYPFDRIYILQHYMNNMFAALEIQKLTAAATLMVLCIAILVTVLLSLERRFRDVLD
ncbi:MAG: sugar ABC transporter permease [Paenibacillus sp.]|uniref:carbohydrate ABC transporter permease n=1 Tax=Paenibacillus sp. TaxID=58172 RepID=UPI00290698B9|nr:sugar ABC transporter permease [Paenibacillus sp.]MDU4696058.1 sugar ABC transporter permease [Paenibacillus sp.]